MTTIGDLLSRDLTRKIEEITQVDQKEEESVFAEITEYVQLQLETGGKTEVLIRAEGNVTAKQLKKVEQAIGEVLEEGKMINLAVSEVGK
jgi:predicted nuclease of predicted toxin-antitoxin system